MADDVNVTSWVDARVYKSKFRTRSATYDNCSLDDVEQCVVNATN